MDTFIGISHGRMDVMGGIADYSGSLVLEKTIKEKTTVHFRFRTDGKIIAKTHSHEENEPDFCIDYIEFLENGILSLSKAKSLFKSKKGCSWAAYTIGCLLILQKNKGIEITGAEIEIFSTIPEGKGVSSSAALEIATFQALAKAYKIEYVGTEMPKMAQKVENVIVGAPCGLMDQISCNFAKPQQILPIICQPDIILEPIDIPDNLMFLGIDSGVRHHVEGASYTDVRIAAFMGYSIIAKLNNINISTLTECRQTHDWENLPYNGYLANINTDKWLEKYEANLPVSMNGKEFLDQFGDSIDGTTTIDPHKTYNIKSCASHPIFENDRINYFKSLLQKLPGEANKFNIYKRLGKLMFESHQSYSNVLLGNTQTNRIVEMLSNKENEGVFGAKITGGGSGGTVCVLAEGQKGLETVKKVYEQYQIEFGQNTHFFE